MKYLFVLFALTCLCSAQFVTIPAYIAQICANDQACIDDYPDELPDGLVQEVGNVSYYVYNNEDFIACPFRSVAT